MEGQGVVDMDHPKYYNGGKGNLNTVMAADPDRYKHLKDAKGNWMVREDVFVRFRNKQGVMAGGLTIGFTGYGSDRSRHHIGPELQIGHQLGDAIDGPVLLIKTAWGGKSLYKDFRPPSAVVKKMVKMMMTTTTTTTTMMMRTATWSSTRMPCQN